MRESIYDYVTDNMREAFNDVCLREMNLDLTTDDLVYDVETESLLQCDGLFLKYCPSKYTIINKNKETRFDLIENPKLMTILTSVYCERQLNKRGIKILGLNQYITDKNTGYGYVSLSLEAMKHLTYNGEIAGTWIVNDINSDNYINETVRLLSLVTKINGTDKMYSLEALDARCENGIQ